MEVYGNAARPGRAGCECHYGPSPVHGPADGFEAAWGQPANLMPSYPATCPRNGTMHDGWFICGPCVRHAPQLKQKAPASAGAFEVLEGEEVSGGR